MRVLVNGVGLWFDVLSPAVVLVGDAVVDRPVVIGVHGGPGVDSTSLAAALGPLSDVAQLIRYDQRGHGRSDPGGPEDWTISAWADDLAGLVTVLGVERPVLFGTSFGATVALACASRHPRQVGAVIAAYGGGRMDEEATVAAFGRLGGEAAADAARGDPADPRASFREWLRVCYPLPRIHGSVRGLGAP